MQQTHQNPGEKSFIPNMIESLKNSFKVDPHSLEEIRQEIAEDEIKNVNFLSLLEKHHDYLKECISVLLTESENEPEKVEEKQETLSRFIHLVNMHGNAEEETLYRALVLNDKQEARLEGIGGQDEHDIAYQLADELEDMNFEFAWGEDVDAKAKVFAHVVANHIKEEEGHMFSIAKKCLEKDELNFLSAEYLERCRKYLDSWGISLPETTPVYSEPFNPGHL